MKVVETERLVLRRATADDAAFILELVTDPSWTRYIGKSKVASLEDAASYIERALVSMYEDKGFGLYLMELKQTGEPVGLCGLIKRPTLDDVDLGFAILPAFCRRGLTLEAAEATLDFAKRELGLTRVVAITSLENPASIALLEKLGFEFEQRIQPEDTGDELRLFGLAL